MFYITTHKIPGGMVAVACRNRKPLVSFPVKLNNNRLPSTKDAFLILKGVGIKLG